MRLNVKSFALTLGLVWGLLVFLTTWWLIFQGKLINEPTFIGSIYPYYRVSGLGSVIGLIYGIIDGIWIGALFAWFYNTINKSER